MLYITSPGIIYCITRYLYFFPPLPISPTLHLFGIYESRVFFNILNITYMLVRSYSICL